MREIGYIAVPKNEPLMELHNVFVFRDINALKNMTFDTGSYDVYCITYDASSEVNNNSGCCQVTLRPGEYTIDYFCYTSEMIYPNKLLLYHGSPNESFTPTFGKGDSRHDFGKGFYLTPVAELAREWSAGTLEHGEDCFLHAYTLDMTGLEVFDFEAASHCVWLAELMRNRRLEYDRRTKKNVELFIKEFKIDVNKYDVITGWRADASYSVIFKEFVSNGIGLELVGSLLRLGEFGTQFCLKSEKAFNQMTELEDRKERVSNEEYRDAYVTRDRRARELMYDMIEHDSNEQKTTFFDITRGLK